MTVPLSSSEQSQIQAVDNQLAQYIKQVQNGTANPNDLTQIHTALMGLATNPRIPAVVQQSLQVVLNQLKHAPTTEASLASLQTAKSQVDGLLAETTSESSSEKDVGGGELGGGGSGESEG